MNRNPDPHVYYIRPVGQDGPIKVGHSIHAHERLRQCMKWSPLPLEIAAMIPIPDALEFDDYAHPAVCNALERRFHLRYADYRLHHEWFAAHPLILSDVQAIVAGTFDLDCLPPWERSSNAFIRREYLNGIGRYANQSRGDTLSPAPRAPSNPEGARTLSQQE